MSTAAHLHPAVAGFLQDIKHERGHGIGGILEAALTLAGVAKVSVMVACRLSTVRRWSLWLAVAHRVTAFGIGARHLRILDVRRSRLGLQRFLRMQGAFGCDRPVEVGAVIGALLLRRPPR